MFMGRYTSVLKCICTRMCMHVSAYGDQRTALDVIHEASSMLVLEAGSLTGLELTKSLGCIASEPSGSACLHTPGAGISSTRYHDRGFWD